MVPSVPPSLPTTPIPPASGLIPIGEAARILGVSLETVRRLERQGELTSVRADGKNRYFDKAAIEKYKEIRPLSVSDVAQQLGVSVSTVRGLEQKGLLKPERSSGGHRQYTQAIIDTYKKDKDTLLKNASTEIKAANTSLSSTPQSISSTGPSQEPLYSKSSLPTKIETAPPKQNIATPVAKEISIGERPLDFTSIPTPKLVSIPVSAPTTIRLATVPAAAFPELVEPASKKSLTAIVSLLIALIAVISVTTLGLVYGTNIAKSPKKLAQQTDKQVDNPNAWDYLKQMVDKDTQQAETVVSPTVEPSSSSNGGGGTTNDTSSGTTNSEDTDSTIATKVATFFAELTGIKAEKQPFAINVQPSAGYLYINLNGDGTYFQVQDNRTPILTIDTDKNIIAAKGSNLDLRGTLTLDGSTGEGGQVLTSGEDHKPHWTDQTKLIAGGLKCDTCQVVGDLQVTGSITSGEGSTIDLNLVAGGVVFGNPDGTVGQDTANFFYNDSTNRLGIGTTTPSSTLDVAGTFTVSSNSVFGGNLDIGAQGDTYLARVGTNTLRLSTANPGPGAIPLYFRADNEGVTQTDGPSIVTGGGGSLSLNTASGGTGKVYINLATDDDVILGGGGGKIGIGTTSPAGTLDIRQNTNGTPTIYARRKTDSGPSGDFITYYNAAGDTVLYRVDNSGNVTSSGSISGGAQTITSTTTPQLRVQYDSSNEVTTSVSSTGTTTLGFAGSSPKAIFLPTANSTTAFQFQNAAGNDVLNIDTTNRRIGINTTAPSGKLHVIADTSVTGSPIYFDDYDSGCNGCSTIIYGRRGRGTAAAPTAVTAVDSIHQIVGQGYDGSAFRDAAEIAFVVDGTPGASDMPGRIVFYTTPDGSSTLAERMRITNGGNVGIGNTNPGSMLTVGSAGNFTVASDGYTTINNDLDVVLGAGHNIDVSSSAAPTVDLLSISNSGFGTTTNNIDGLSVAFTQADDADASDTNAGLNIAMTSSSGDADTLYGVRIGNITAGSATETGLSIGTGWDNALTAQGKVGIGTTAPNSQLEVSAGNIDGIRVTSTGQSPYVRLYADSATSTNRNWGITSNFHANGVFEILYSTTSSTDPSTAAIYITSGGLVGLGSHVVTPANRLDVNGSVAIGSYYGTAGPSNGLIVSGNVGIGTTGPDKKLDILDTSAAQLRLTYTDGSVYTDFQTDSNGDLKISNTGNHMYYQGSTPTLYINHIGGAKLDIVALASAAIIGTSTNHDVYFRTNGTDIGIMKATGRFGFGHTNPQAQVHVASTAAATIGLIVQGASSQSANLQEWQNSSGTALASISSAGVASFAGFSNSAGTTGSVLFYGSSGAITQDNSNFFWDDTNNRLGIGTTSPVEQLHVAGGLQVGTALSGWGSPLGTGQVTVSNTSNSSVVWLGQSASAFGSIGWVYNATPANAYLRISSSGQPIVIGTGSHTVGINTTTPTGAAKFLQVLTDSTTDAAANIQFNAANAAHKVLVIQGKSGQTASLQEWQNSSGTVLNRIGPDGKIYFGNVDTGGFYNFYDSTAGTAFRVQHQAATSGDAIYSAVLGNAATGTVYAVHATGSTTGNWGYYVQQSGAGNAVYQAVAISTGDAYSQYAVNGGQNWTVGLDNSDSDKFKIAGSASLGSSDYLTINTSGQVGIGTSAPNEQLEITGNLRLPATTSTTGIIKSGSNLLLHTYGLNNFFSGITAGNLTLTTGSAVNNTGVGRASLTALTTGAGNTAVGSTVLTGTTTGDLNTAIGNQAMVANTSGDTNTASGYFALTSNTTGSNNTAIGAVSLFDLNITADDGTGNNTAVGYNTGRGIVTGVNNTILGANVSGLSSSLSNNIIIADGSGNRRINVDSNGNIGIATTTPNVSGQTSVQRVVTLSGSDSNSYGVFEVNANTAIAGRLMGAYGFTSSGQASGYTLPAYIGSWLEGSTATKLGASLRLFTQSDNTAGATERMRIDSSGNVGIGTTSPFAKLQVGSNTSVSDSTAGLEVGTGANTAIIAQGSTNPSVQAYSTTSNVITKIQSVDSSSLGLVGTQSNHAFSIYTNNTRRVTVDTSGNVGIGTTAPATMLDVTGDLTVNGQDIYFTSGYTGNRFSYLGGGVYSLYGSGDEVGQFSIATSYLNGSLGIGTTAPGAKVQINGAASGVGLIVKANATTPGNLQEWQNSSGTALLTVSSTGQIVSTTAATSVIDVSGASSSYALDLANNQFIRSKTTGGTKFIILGVSTDNNTYLTSNTGQDIRISPDLGASAGRGISVLNTSGNVGIGTTAPGSRLEVQGAAGSSSSGYAARIIDSNTTNGMVLVLGYSLAGSGDKYKSISVDSSGLNFGTLPDALNASPTTQMILTGTGRLGIGTTAPNAKFEVQDGSGHLILSNNSFGSDWGVITTDTGLSSTKYALASSQLNGTYVNAPASREIGLRIANVTKLAIDSSGNVGIGTTTPGKKLDVIGDAQFGANSTLLLSDTGGGNFRIIGNQILGIDSDLVWIRNAAASVQTATFDNTNGNVGIGTTTWGTNAAKVLALANGTAPTTSPADQIQLYAEDVAASSELKVRDEAGNVTTLSPHNYSLFRPKEDYILPWSFYSKNTNMGKEINVDMYGMVQAVELLSGQQFIYAKDLNTGVDLATTLDPAVSVVSLEQRLTALEGEVAGMRDNQASDGTLTPEQQEALGGDTTTPTPEETDPIEPTPEETTTGTVDPNTVLADFLKSAVTFEDSVTVNKNLDVKADAYIYGTLVADSLEVAHGFTIHGDATFLAKATFEGDIQAKGTLIISNQQAGYATIPTGATKVIVTFTKPFTAEQGVPVVTTNTTNSFTVSRIVDTTTQSFTIEIPTPADKDLTFNWVAILTQAPATTIGEAPNTPTEGIQPVVEDVTQPQVPAAEQPVIQPELQPVQPEQSASVPDAVLSTTSTETGI